MRILYLTDIRFPIERANGMQTMETAHALARLGHEVRLGVRPDPLRPPRDPFDFYDLPPEPRLRVERAPIAGPFWLRRAEFLSWSAWRGVFTRDVDLVFTRDLGVADLLHRLPWRRPLVYESHGFAPVFAETLSELVTGADSASARKVRRLTNRERAVWKAADGYVATTRVLADEMTSKFGSRARVVVLSNGVRLPVEMPASGSSGGQMPVAMYAGHLYPWKGVDVFVQALALVPQVRGVILGGSEGDADMTRVRALAESVGVSSRVTFSGFVAKAELPARMAEADVYVLPTLDTPSARYTSPLKMFEYMAMGRPIVATDLPPVREVLRNGENARLVPPGDANALAEALREVAADPVLGRRLAARARSDVEGYSWKRRAERLEALFTEVLSLTPSQRLTSI